MEASCKFERPLTGHWHLPTWLIKKTLNICSKRPTQERYGRTFQCENVDCVAKVLVLGLFYSDRTLLYFSKEEHLPGRRYKNLEENAEKSIFENPLLLELGKSSETPQGIIIEFNSIGNKKFKDDEKIAEKHHIKSIWFLLSEAKITGRSQKRKEKENQEPIIQIQNSSLNRQIANNAVKNMLMSYSAFLQVVIWYIRNLQISNKISIIISIHICICSAGIWGSKKNLFLIFFFIFKQLLPLSFIWYW